MAIRTNINSDQFYCEDGNATDHWSNNFCDDGKIKDHWSNDSTMRLASSKITDQCN
jgi:hypothetical protein